MIKSGKSLLAMALTLASVTGGPSLAPAISPA